MYIPLSQTPASAFPSQPPARSSPFQTHYAFLRPKLRVWDGTWQGNSVAIHYVNQSDIEFQKHVPIQTGVSMGEYKC